MFNPRLSSIFFITGESAISQVMMTPLPFGQLGFGQLGFGQLGFGQLGFGQLGFGQLGFGQLGYNVGPIDKLFNLGPKI